jgi:uncharacterized protein (TIGR02145 family)
MKHLLLLPLLALALHMQAQRVTNVTAEQQGQELLIHYQLEADGPVEVLLYLSTDRGSRWEGPLKSCTGDVGPNVAPGTDKRIRWEVLKDRELVGDGIAFKVVAKGGVKKDWLNPALTYGSVTDIDGNTYATIEIGTQLWMAENLRTTRYRNGDPIPEVKGDDQWTGLTTGAWAHYENDPKYEVPYGKVYNWYTVKDPRKVCPTGWHVPTDAEWTTLTDHLGGEDYAGGTGGKLKSKTSWNAPNTGATNASGFSGLPGGNRNDDDGFFGNLGKFGYWWSASESGAELAWYRYLDYFYVGINRLNYYKRNGFSVRCLRD